MRERLKIPNNKQEANLKNAMRYGIGFRESSGRIRAYISSLYQKYYRATNVRIYKGFVYIFQRDILITVYELPEKHRAEVDEIFRRRGETHGKGKR